jgi:hypothetical protein
VAGAFTASIFFWHGLMIGASEVTMKGTILLAAVAAACVTGMQCFAAAQAPPAPTAACLDYDDLEQLHMVSSTSAVATTRRGEIYMVTFRSACQAMSSGAFFILERNRLGICLDANDRLDISTPAPPCTVQSVVPTQSVPIRSGQP